MAARKKKPRYTLRSNGKTLVFVERSKSGAVVGLPGLKNPERPHLTITREERGIGRHITRDAGGQRISLGAMSRDEMMEIVGFLQPHLVPWREELAAYAMTQTFLDRAQLTDSTGEALAEIMNPNFADAETWAPVRLGSPEAPGFTVAFRRENGRVLVTIALEQELFEASPEELMAARAFIRALGIEHLTGLSDK